MQFHTHQNPAVMVSFKSDLGVVFLLFHAITCQRSCCCGVVQRGYWGFQTIPHKCTWELYAIPHKWLWELHIWNQWAWAECHHPCCSFHLTVVVSLPHPRFKNEVVWHYLKHLHIACTVLHSFGIHNLGSHSKQRMTKLHPVKFKQKISNDNTLCNTH